LRRDQDGARTALRKGKDETLDGRVAEAERREVDF
jgi:hypothetical protein